MSNRTSSGWSTESERASYLRRVSWFLLKGLSVGLLAGMGAFVYNAPQFLPTELDARLLLVPVFAAGVFAHAFASSLRRSIRLGIVGFFGGLVVFLAAWIAPLFVLSYSNAALDVMLPSMFGEAMSAAFINYSTTYFAGYLLTVSTAAFWE